VFGEKVFNLVVMPIPPPSRRHQGPFKKNDKRRRDDNFVAAVERKASCPKGNQGKPAPTRDHFEKLLDAPCPHHEAPIKHTLRECQLMKN
jgi:hypothetical protein